MDIARSSIFCIMTENSRRRGARRLILSARSSRISDMARASRAGCLRQSDVRQFIDLTVPRKSQYFVVPAVNSGSTITRQY